MAHWQLYDLLTPVYPHQPSRMCPLLSIRFSARSFRASDRDGVPA